MYAVTTRDLAEAAMKDIKKLQADVKEINKAVERATVDKLDERTKNFRALR